MAAPSVMPRDELPDFKDPEWKAQRLLEHAAQALALCEIVMQENVELRAKLALLEQRAPEDVAPLVACGQCGELHHAELIGVDGRCYKCRSRKKPGLKKAPR